ncbi:UDP-glucose 4-epimerase GalE [Shewanella maritima]|uniref:UDP-glucose 4-epimerase GalE n=1 Tax=Shewanella maritima TaxID=2520507 RepID=UPI0037350300
MNVLVTGGAGYIGSHTVLCLLNEGYHVIVLDNLCNSSVEAIKRVEQLTQQSVTFIEGDVCNKQHLENVFTKHKVDCVIHFAALKAVGESALQPLKYHHNNVSGSINLLSCMAKHQVNQFIFSSSATVYGEQNPYPYIETMPLGTPSSPYGTTKMIVERVLEDNNKANVDFKAISLRYFNPIGAHPSGEIGEDPSGIPNNLLPFVAQVAVGKREKLTVFGDDYPTPDGTCLRDYLHVMDLAEGHVAALNWLKQQTTLDEVAVFNLGTGTGTSVLNIIRAFETETGKPVPYEVANRREGDLPAFWANADKAKQVLKWQAKRDINAMMQDTWRWQSNNPDGYSK